MKSYSGGTSTQGSRYAKRDYEVVVSVLKDAADMFSTNEVGMVAQVAGVVLSHVAGRFVAKFQADAPHTFNPDKFIAACGLGKEQN